MRESITIILLFIGLSINAQYFVTDGAGNRVFINGNAVKSPGVPVYSVTPSTTGEGQILWYNDLESLSLTNNMVPAHIDTIYGYTDQINGFSRGAGFCEIREESGNQYMRWRMTQGVGGGGSGTQVKKPLRLAWGGQENTDQKLGMWWFVSLRFDPAMSDTVSGKMSAGFRSGIEDNWNVTPHIEGFSARKTYNKVRSHRMQLQWEDKPTSSGASSDGWKYTFPTGTDAIINNDWHQFAVRCEINLIGGEATGLFEFYIDENLAGVWYDLLLRNGDTVWIDESTWGWFPGNLYEPPQNTYMDLDNLGLCLFTEGDSTLTGTERAPDFHILDLPGWPLDEDTTGWGQY